MPLRSPRAPPPAWARGTSRPPRVGFARLPSRSAHRRRAARAPGGLSKAALLALFRRARHLGPRPLRGPGTPATRDRTCRFWPLIPFKDVLKSTRKLAKACLVGFFLAPKASRIRRAPPVPLLGRQVVDQRDQHDQRVFSSVSAALQRLVWLVLKWSATVDGMRSSLHLFYIDNASIASMRYVLSTIS